MDDVKRGPGRPKAEPLKKGRPAWREASVTDVSNKEDGWRYHWVNKDSSSIAKRLQEDWQMVGGITSDKVTVDPTHKMDDGKSLTSIHEKHDLVLMKLPEYSETGNCGESRDEMQNEKTKNRTMGLTAHIKKEMGKEGAEMHGEITISSRRGTQVID